MADLLELYKSAGGINETEQEGIVTAPRGRAFFITSPMDRAFVDIIAYPTVVEVMGEGKKRLKRGTCTICGTSFDCRPRG